MHNFKELIVWQKSIQLAIKTYNFSKTLTLLKEVEIIQKMIFGLKKKANKKIMILDT